jgi:predicted GNAT family N-acyltransferase
MNVSFRVVTAPEDLIKAMVVRGIVFCGEQRIAYAIERDELDTHALHVLGELDGEPVAAGRVIESGDHAGLGRIAVRSPFRGLGVGHALTEFMLGVARERGYREFHMHAQAHLERFYAEHGFEPRGPRFFEAGIEHQLMVCCDVPAVPRAAAEP